MQGCGNLDNLGPSICEVSLKDGACQDMGGSERETDAKLQMWEAGPAEEEGKSQWFRRILRE